MEVYILIHKTKECGEITEFSNISLFSSYEKALNDIGEVTFYEVDDRYYTYGTDETNNTEWYEIESYKVK